MRTPQGVSTAAFSTAVEGAEGQYTSSTVVSLFRFERHGHIAPGEMFQDMVAGGSGTSVIGALPLNGVVNKDGTVFVVCADSTVFTFNTSDNIIRGTLTGTTQVATVGSSNLVDIVTFRNADGTEWIAWSWETSATAQADIARIRSDGAPTTKSTDWFSTLTGSAKLAKGVPHILHIGPDSILYCTNGQYIASHDPLTSSGSTQAFNLGAGWTAVTLESYGNYLAIGARKTSAGVTAASETRLYLWDGYTPTPNFVYDLSDYNVTALKNHEGGLYIFTQGKNNQMRVKTISGNGVVTIFERDIGNAPKAKSVESFKGMVIWGQDSGNYRIGALLNLGDKAGYHEIMHPHISTASLADLGLVKQLTSSFLYAGNKVGSTFSIWRINNDSYYPNADFRTRLFILPYKSTLKRIGIYPSQFGSGASLTTSIFESYDAISIGGSTDLMAAHGLRTITNATHGALNEISIPIDIPNISSFYMNFRFDHASSTNTAAIIQRVEVDYEASLNQD